MDGLGVKQKMQEQLQIGLMYIGFICSCGLYEFGGVFFMTYFNPFLQTSIGLSSGDIGTIVLVAQICDAISNPTVGLLIEHVRIPLLGRKRGFHFIGSVVITCCFPLMWMGCSFCHSRTTEIIYYAVIAAFLNCMTPAMFLPHLSMISLLAKNAKQRLVLGGLSSFAKQFWGILAYSTMWLLIGMDSNDENEDFGQLLGEKLKIASFVVSGVGIVCTVVFHSSVWNLNETQGLEDEAGNAISKRSTINDFKTLIKSPSFYLLGLFYFVCNSGMTFYKFYQVFYFEQTLMMPKEAAAYLPFIYLTFAGLGSIAVKAMVKKLRPGITFGLAQLLTIAAGVAFCLVPVQYGNVVIIPVILVSTGSAIMYTLALSFVSSLIVKLKVSDVTVWGIFNLLDRIIFGLSFITVQEFRPCPSSKECCGACSDFYRFVFGGGIVLLACSAGLLLLAARCSGLSLSTAPEKPDQRQLQLTDIKMETE